MVSRKKQSWRLSLVAGLVVGASILSPLSALAQQGDAIPSGAVTQSGGVTAPSPSGAVATSGGVTTASPGSPVTTTAGVTAAAPSTPSTPSGGVTLAGGATAPDNTPAAGLAAPDYAPVTPVDVAGAQGSPALDAQVRPLVLPNTGSRPTDQVGLLVGLLSAGLLAAGALLRRRGLSGR